MVEIVSMKSSARGWEHLCVPIEHGADKDVSRLHVDRDACKGSTDIPKEAPLKSAAISRLGNRFSRNRPYREE